MENDDNEEVSMSAAAVFGLGKDEKEVSQLELEAASRFADDESVEEELFDGLNVLSDKLDINEGD
jgi:hypothetical protein